MDKNTQSPEKLPDDFIEFLVVQETGWTLEYIRSMKEVDYKKYAIMAQWSQQIKNNREKFKMSIASRSPIF